MSEQFPAYPGPYNYEPFGAGAGYPGGPVPGRPPRPQTVDYAFYLMLAGAAMTLVALLYGLTQISRMREKAVEASHANLTDSQIDMIVTVTIITTIVFSVISIGLWIWMAFMNRAGRNWARITGTVFFGLYTLSELFSVIAAKAGAISNVISIVTWLVALAAVILLWIKQSSAYFRPAPAPFYPPYPHG
ncbi:hypothetical protein ACFXHA_16920 [Nocardia sp. NPDC059240]|uniref:hypothetical protein n=1 Tax=Nocardia sp. NPDC059240 TaxID=3346786 RepID=UPI0036A81DE7